MSTALITEARLTAIANAIRAKNGSSDTYTPPQMAAAIAALPEGGITPTGTLSITQNGTHDVAQYASANVNVHVSSDPHITEAGVPLPDRRMETVGGQKLLTLQMINGSNDENMNLGPVRIYNEGTMIEQLNPIWSLYHCKQNSGDNIRQYRIDVYDIPLPTPEKKSLVTVYYEYSHMSHFEAVVSDWFYVSKIMTSADAATSGSNDEDGCVLYGTFDDASGGSVGYADYTAGTQITTNNPGSGNKSSFIIWLKPVD